MLSLKEHRDLLFIVLVIGLCATPISAFPAYAIIEFVLSPIYDEETTDGVFLCLILLFDIFIAIYWWRRLHRGKVFDKQTAQRYDEINKKP